MKRSKARLEELWSNFEKLTILRQNLLQAREDNVQQIIDRLQSRLRTEDESFQGKGSLRNQPAKNTTVLARNHSGPLLPSPLTGSAVSTSVFAILAPVSG
jgi:hypothetical protein